MMRRVGLVVGLGAAVALLPMGAATAASVAPDEADPLTAGIEVVVTPVASEHGQVIAPLDVPGIGLVFSPVAPVEQEAHHDVIVRNTGVVALRDLRFTVERGRPLVPPATVLGPGEEITVRSVLAFTFDEVARGLAGVQAFPVEVTALTPDDEVVTAGVDRIVGLAAVLSTPQLSVDVTVVPDAGAASDAGPAVRWTADEALAGVERAVRHRVVVRNDSTVAVEAVEVLATGVDAPVMLVPTGEVLEPGAEVVAEFERLVTATALGLVPAAVDVEGAVTTELSVSARDVVTGTATTERRETVVPAVVEARVLPVAGPPRAGELTLVALLSLGFGMALLVAAPRPGRLV